jgi:hypothetical protein
MSNFDPTKFLSATTTHASEKRDPLPEGNYQAVIGQLGVKAWEKNDRSGVYLTVPLAIQVPAEQQETVGKEMLTLTDTIMLDLDSNGDIDYSKGKNAKLTNYRDATGTNEEGEEFAPAMLQGRSLQVRIKHDMYEGTVQEKVKGVLPA